MYVEDGDGNGSTGGVMQTEPTTTPPAHDLLPSRHHTCRSLPGCSRRGHDAAVRPARRRRHHAPCRRGRPARHIGSPTGSSTALTGYFPGKSGKRLGRISNTGWYHAWGQADLPTQGGKSGATDKPGTKAQPHNRCAEKRNRPAKTVLTA